MSPHTLLLLTSGHLSHEFGPQASYFHISELGGWMYQLVNCLPTHSRSKPNLWNIWPKASQKCGVWRFRCSKLTPAISFQSWTAKVSLSQSSTTIVSAGLKPWPLTVTAFFMIFFLYHLEYFYISNAALYIFSWWNARKIDNQGPKNSEFSIFHCFWYLRNSFAWLKHYCLAKSRRFEK